jgi:ketopantoate hydroxymethyltransferase
MKGISSYTEEVRKGTFPSPDHSFAANEGTMEHLEAIKE